MGVNLDPHQRAGRVKLFEGDRQMLRKMLFVTFLGIMLSGCNSVPVHQGTNAHTASTGSAISDLGAEQDITPIGLLF